MWTKLSDGYLDDPSMLWLSDHAIVLDIEATIYANRYLTDGFFPSVMLRRSRVADPNTAMAELVDAGVWTAVENGWQRADWTDQPSREDVEARRAEDAARQDRSRRHRKGDHSKCLPSYCEVVRHSMSHAVTPPVTHAGGHTVSHSVPARPDPTRKGGEGRLAPSRLDGAPTLAGDADWKAPAGTQERREQEHRLNAAMRVDGFEGDVEGWRASGGFSRFVESELARK